MKATVAPRARPRRDEMPYEYGVVIRRQRKDSPVVWQFWIGAGCVREATSFLAVMDWAGARGFEAFAAGNFDELAVPEVLLKREVKLPPPPPLPKSTSTAGRELGGAKPPRAAGRAGQAASRPKAKPVRRSEPAD
jgi:hypothetical protein